MSTRKWCVYPVGKCHHNDRCQFPTKCDDLKLRDDMVVHARSSEEIQWRKVWES